MMNIRLPVVAGMFYSSDPEHLKEQIEACFRHPLGPKDLKRKEFAAAIVPHAGYPYSGPVAAWVYSIVEKANYILLGPNHTGLGPEFSLMKSGLWKTPLGEIIIDFNMSEKLLKACDMLESDFLAHEKEHSIEVQLPFLQFKYGSDFKIVPICILNEMADEELLDKCVKLGKCIASVVKKLKEKWILIATSDFSHYVPQEIAKKVDKKVIKKILEMDEVGFFEEINKNNASVCGYGPIAVAISYAKHMGCKKAELLKYATSGDAVGDFGSVVGYASIIFR